MNILLKSSWGSDDPTRAAMILQHGNALAGAGHKVRMFLLGEAVTLARPAVRDNMFPLGWPPLTENWDKSIALGIHIEFCEACSSSRGVTNEEIAQSGGQIGTPKTFVEHIEWADKIIAE